MTQIMAFGAGMILVFGLGVDLLVAQDPLEMVNDPRCTPISFIMRFWEGHGRTPFGYAVLNPDLALVPGDEIQKAPLQYDEDLHRCYSPLNYICVKDTDCGTGAICSSKALFPVQFYGSPDNPRRLDPSKYPLIGLCRCSEDKVENQNHTGCLTSAKFGESCDPVKKPCGSNVDCLNNKCACAPTKAVTRIDTSYSTNTTYYYAVLPDKPYEGNPSDILEFPRVYDEERKRCFMKVNPGVCLLRDDDCPGTKSCSSYWSGNFGSWEGDESHDHDSKHPLLGRCGCYGGMTRQFLDPKTDKCVPSPKYGETCNADLPCSSNELNCINDRCACPNEGSKYDSLKEVCVSQIGSKCDYSSECVSNAECSGYPSTCECKDGFASSNGTCYGKHMAPCHAEAKCDPAGFFKCIDGYCKCGDLLNQIYDSDVSKCQALVGSKCSTNTGNSLAVSGCVRHAMCMDGVCKCRPGMVQNSERNCENFRGYGAYCDPQGCNYKDGWACIENACKCVDENLKVKNGNCVSEIGSYCGYVEIVGKKSDKEADATKHLYYYVGCDEGICDAPVGERSVCKKPCSG